MITYTEKTYPGRFLTAFGMTRHFEGTRGCLKSNFNTHLFGYLSEIDFKYSILKDEWMTFWTAPENSFQLFVDRICRKRNANMSFYPMSEINNEDCAFKCSGS